MEANPDQRRTGGRDRGSALTAFYNEIEPFAAQWLRNLIDAGLIAPGDVDERDIRDIKPSELAGYTQCHFFAGIGVWSYALRLAGWPDNRPVWTGSPPCQPFSAAGRKGGVADERHLWPHFHYLIAERRPQQVFGEQVASKDGLGWLDLVQTDMEGTGYAGRAVDLCAAGVGAPHIRQRQFFFFRDLGQPAWTPDAARGGRGEERALDRGCGSGDSAQGWSAGRSGIGGVGDLADTNGRKSGETGAIQSGGQYGQQQKDSCSGGRPGCAERGSEVRFIGMGHDDDARLQGHAGDGDDPARWAFADRPVTETGGDGPLADAAHQQQYWGRDDGARRGTEHTNGGEIVVLADDDDEQRPRRETGLGFGDASTGRLENTTTSSGLRDDMRPGPTNGFWGDADWLFCRDGKWRPVKPGLEPLAHGAPQRVGRLRAYGNAIVSEAAAHVIAAFLEVEADENAALDASVRSDDDLIGDLL